MTKKLSELIGEEGSKEFTDYILKLLSNKETNPNKLCQQLEFALDQETEKFVISLWKSLLFEAYKLQKLQKID